MIAGREGHRDVRGSSTKYATFRDCSLIAVPTNQEKGHGAVPPASVAERKLMHDDKYATSTRHARLIS
jgi:hypothetical protein